MPAATWSAQAEAELAALVPDPAVRAQLRKHAAEGLRYVVTCTVHEGAEDGIMWRRGITEQQRRQLDAGWLEDDDDDGTRPWDYFLLYRPLAPAAFEVLAIRSIRQIAARALAHGASRSYFAGTVCPVPVLGPREGFSCAPVPLWAASPGLSR